MCRALILIAGVPKIKQRIWSSISIWVVEGDKVQTEFPTQNVLNHWKLSSYQFLAKNDVNVPNYVPYLTKKSRVGNTEFNLQWINVKMNL